MRAMEEKQEDEKMLWHFLLARTMSTYFCVLSTKLSAWCLAGTPVID